MTLAKKSLVASAAAALSLAPSFAFAEVSAETAYVFNTFSFLLCGVLVMFIAAGFAMLEAGLVRTKNVATICLKNIALYSISGIMFYLVGYGIMYPAEFSVLAIEAFGFSGFFYDPSAAEIALKAGADGASAEEVIGATGYSVSSDWFFQMVFVATAASVVSGTIAERTKLWSFLVFVVVLSAVLYPIQGSWTWGGGWLADAGFSDFAGSTIVHSVGGWAALVGAILVGPRKGKFVDGRINPMPGSNIPLATLGTFILWFGWFGFNGGSQLALGSALDATAMSIVFVNTNLAAAAGCIGAMIMAQLWFGKVDITMGLNGALAGLVSITAGPDLDFHLLSIIIGLIGGVLVVFSVVILERMRIDDVVGAISVHLTAGIWGTLAVGIFGNGNLGVQIMGIVAIGVFMVVTSLIVWSVISATMGLRVDEDDEAQGLDVTEVGLEAYPEFGKSSF